MSAGSGGKNSGDLGARDGVRGFELGQLKLPWDLHFGREPLLREIHIKSNVLPKAKKSWQVFLKLLNSALLQFINQSMNQRALRGGTSGPALTPVPGC